MQHKVKVYGHKYFESNTEDRAIIVLLSCTVGFYHVIIDSAYQDNAYFHLTKEQLEEKFKIFPDNK